MQAGIRSAVNRTPIQLLHHLTAPRRPLPRSTCDSLLLSPLPTNPHNMLPYQLHRSLVSAATTSVACIGKADAGSIVSGVQQQNHLMHQIHNHHQQNHRLLQKQLFSTSSSSSSDKSSWPLTKVREEFVNYFIDKHKHAHIKSSPVAPLNDPTLLFTNAGMNQFKPIFLGTVNPSSPLFGLKRVVNSQKCIRAGGKHNDLDDVGKDTYHHTFFEMLGTWSFGDYFKKEAIDWAYDILVNVYKLPKERLYASYFAGDEALGLPADDEAKTYWLQYLPAERILPFDKKANFWEMGETGPCGPCSEIHFDRIGNRDASKLVNMDDPDVIEIWNLVFIQFNREANGNLSSLPDKHIDTGMGLERLTSILQNKRSNYDIDAFQKIFSEIQRVANCAPYTGLLGHEDKAQQQPYKDTAMRIIADHIRTLSFAIADGAYPSNEGRGYVLRRILRRAVRYGIQTLGAEAGFFHKLVPVVVGIFGENYPELGEREKLITSILHDEEMAFNSLLKRGEKHINQIMSQSTSNVISGETAFFLYDTLGFPLDLTQIIAAERGFTVDATGFAKSMELQKSRSRADTRSKRMIGRDALSLDANQIADLGSKGVPLTNDNFKYFDGSNRATHLEAILTSTGFQTSISSDSISSNPDKVFGILLTDTPFYSESGGQVADSGSLVLSNEQGDSIELQVLDVQSYGGYVLHNCIYAAAAANNNSSSSSKKISWGIKSEVVAKIDLDRRRKTAPNHTSTHILNYAIRKVLGNDSDQRGSLVSSDKLRFDFSHQSAPRSTEVEEIQNIVNDVIRAEQDVFTGTLPLRDAMKIPGVRAVFGEAYPDPVRVVSVGTNIADLLAEAAEAAKDNNNNSRSSGSGSGMTGSVEFCGGTHVKNTRDLELFIVTEEGSISQGVRRISGVTGTSAIQLQGVAQEFYKNFGQLQHRLTTLSAVVGGGGGGDNKLSSNEATQDYMDLIDALDADLIKFRSNVDNETWGYVDKVKIRIQLDSLSKALSQLKNKVMLWRGEEFTKEVIYMAKLRDEAGLQLLAVSVPGIGSDSKMQKKAIEDLRKATGDRLCLFIIFPDAVDDKFTIVTVVPEGRTFSASTTTTSSSSSSKTPFTAVSWLNQALAAVSGRGGGKPSVAQGSAVDKSKIPLLLELAEGSFKS